VAPLFLSSAGRYERKSVYFTTNLKFGRWPELFGDVTLAEAPLGRRIHCAHIFNFKRRLYRFAQRSTKEMSV
jgi:DNA replication protein DnaC